MDLILQLRYAVKTKKKRSKRTVTKDALPAKMPTCNTINQSKSLRRDISATYRRAKAGKSIKRKDVEHIVGSGH